MNIACLMSALIMMLWHFIDIACFNHTHDDQRKEADYHAIIRMNDGKKISCERRVYGISAIVVMLPRRNRAAKLMLRRNAR